jgi:2-dehydropantoate 2-reductase
MRFAVIGAGGVGGYFGGKLAHGGADVSFLVRGRTLQALRTRGLRVDSIGGNFALERVHVTDDPREIGAVDVVFVATKAWQVAEAVANIAPLLGAGTAVIPLENGMEAPDIIAAAAGREHTLGGLCGIVAFIVEPGHIRHAGVDPFIMFGELDGGTSARVERIRDACLAAGVDAQLSDDIGRSLWTKFLFITPMSGVGAVTRVPTGVWRTMPETRAMARAAVDEIIALAAARGVDLGPDAAERTFGRYDGLPHDATASMQRDVIEGKPSELDAQLGAVVRMGRAAGVPTPVCEWLLHALLPQERRARGISASA